MMSRPLITLLLCMAPLAACVSDPGRIDEAAERRAANDPQAMSRIAETAMQSGDLEAAKSFYGRAAKLAPADPETQIRYAQALAALNNVDEAVAVLRQAQAHAPNDALLSLTLGRLLVSARQANVATGVFRRGLVAHPRDTALLVGLGVALDLAGDQAGAQAVYARALALDPGNAVARNDLALSLALSNQPTEAVRRLSALRDELVRKGAEPAQIATVDGNLALAYSLSGDVQRAVKVGGAALKPADLAHNTRFYSALAGGAFKEGGKTGAP